MIVPVVAAGFFDATSNHARRLLLNAAYGQTLLKA